ncbi:hypothetical protein [Agrobacterium tumefaciens]|uniref:hypothetical protein n=1 Tax=Agrobacterium tumefaciens TaxID=358 RepID=UPI001572B975|nr:hypothetical protein [Agrobacterium tumefaciens]NTB01066.1 hypothetical protein [Agrobacterium tumefaciens]
MPYAFEGGICTDPVAGAIEITEAQYSEALDAIDSGKAVTIAGGFGITTPTPAEEGGGANTDALTMPITRRQLRLTLVRNGIALASVETAIATMPDGLTKEEAQIEWADASTFNRNHPTLLLIASALGLTEAQVDAMWRQAVAA